MEKSKYRGMHYPEPFFLWWPGLFYWLWRRWFCPRERHLFSEVLSPGWDINHYFSCDACGLVVEIGRVGPFTAGEMFNEWK